MFRRNKSAKLMWTGVAIACALGAGTLKFAWATNGSGAGSTTVAGPVLLEEMGVKGETDTEEVELKTKGMWTARIVHFHFAPGGHTGWHSHPGPVFVMVTAGTLTLEHSDGSVAVYPAGTGFVEDPHRVHIARNESATEEMELDAFILIPLGAPVRVDEPAP
jgi:quercetin dioxygenase-like cupin family protein